MPSEKMKVKRLNDNRPLSHIGLVVWSRGQGREFGIVSMYQCLVFKAC